MTTSRKSIRMMMDPLALAVLMLLVAVVGGFAPVLPMTKTRHLAPHEPPRRLQQPLQALEEQPLTSSNEPITIPPPSYEYKDDCFGFLSFLGGFATQDLFFLGCFVVLSLVAAVGTASKWLPADSQRPTIVDRKIPAVVALLTWMFSTNSNVVLDLLRHAVGGSSDWMVDTIDPTSRMIQLVLCGFSVTTGLFDIRWRDRFDYPEEYRD